VENLLNRRYFTYYGEANYSGTNDDYYAGRGRTAHAELAPRLLSCCARHYWLHRWVGLAAGLVLALLGLTGSLMVWQAPLDAALNPQWFRAPAACAAPPSRWRARWRCWRSTHRRRAQTVVAPREPGAAYQVWEARDAASGRRTEHFIDPACGVSWASANAARAWTPPMRCRCCTSCTAGCWRARPAM
jgi:hypothetical protein